MSEEPSGFCKAAADGESMAGVEVPEFVAVQIPLAEVDGAVHLVTVCTSQSSGVPELVLL